MPRQRPYRIGTGAGFSSDRLDPAIDLVKRGQLDTIVFECVGERTLAFGHRDRQADPAMGYNRLLEARLRAMLPLCRAHDTRLITNMGVANPQGAAEVALRVARDLDLTGLKIAVVTGDDVLGHIASDTHLTEPDCSVAEIGRTPIGANAYLGAQAIAPALEAGADLIITGRVADPALFLAPLAHHFDWADDDWPTLGGGTLVGHLLECAAQVTGGYFADPGYKDVANLAFVGFPLAEVDADGNAVITKLPGTGGCVDTRTVKEQMLYEVHDPSAYLTPDVTADFSIARVSPAGDDRVQVFGASGTERPEDLKVTVAFDGGYLAEAEVSYAGSGAMKRARVAGQIVEERLATVHGIDAPCRTDLIGINALHGIQPEQSSDIRDVRLRIALRSPDQQDADAVLWEVEALLCCGPAGGGGYRGRVDHSVLTYSTFLARNKVTPSVEVRTA
ncbi:MAG: acyclic terpene utilization AtuA family protein [Pseudomonadota bacterium]|nr:acyclic terpene utilization AtuA family protein [Pseudomonadota bacterium]